MARTTTPRIVAVGSVGLDTVETPAGKRTDMLGGSAVHFAVSASFQTRVGLVGIVGSDFPPAHIAFMRKRGIDLAGLEIVKGGKTFRWAGSYLNDLNAADTHCTALNVFATFKPELPEAYRRAPVLFLANISPGLQLHVISQMDKGCYRICDTMNLWIRTARAELRNVFAKVHMVIMNDGEARMFTGETNLVRAGRKMLALGPEYCIIKKGEHGAMAFGRNGFFAAVPAYPVERVVDPTGAGDSFAGGVVGHIARTGDTGHDAIVAALRQGAVMGSFNVSDFSCNRFRRLTPRELAARVAEFERMTGAR